jgi:TolB-like protein
MTAVTDADQPVRFGSFELDIRSRELHNGATRIRLQDQPFEILRMMLERPGRVVTREELQQRLWPDGTFVDFEHSLNAAVKRLRAALGDDAENPRFVETVPRRGYRFIARSDEETTARDAAARLTAPSVRLAVLPFVDLSQEDRDGYFAEGLTDEMIAQLGQMYRSRIGVISRTSSMVFRDTALRAREIGDALRAGYLLEGSVRRQGDRARITARLVEASSETQLWVETYESSLTDALFVQQDIATRIARSLAIEILPENRQAPVSSNPEAYRAYLKGRYYWNMLADTGVEQAADTWNVPFSSIQRVRLPTQRSPAYASSRPSITTRHHAQLWSVLEHRQRAHWISIRPSSKRIWRWATCCGCSNGTGLARRRPTPERSC